MKIMNFQYSINVQNIFLKLVNVKVTGYSLQKYVNAFFEDWNGSKAYYD
jgi:hypothetical protein